jgi:hypothetical protein
MLPMLRSLRAVCILTLAAVIACQPATDPQSQPLRPSQVTVQAATINHALNFAHAYLRVPDHPDLDLQLTWTMRPVEAMTANWAMFQLPPPRDPVWSTGAAPVK